MPSTALGFSDVKVRKTCFLSHEAYCVGETYLKMIIVTAHYFASTPMGVGCVSEGGTWESFLREPTSRQMRVLSWIGEQCPKRRKEHEHTLKGGGVSCKYLTIAIAVSGRKGGPEKELECTQQQDRGGLWEAHQGTTERFEL